jgi:hypothetical protein
MSREVREGAAAAPRAGKTGRGARGWALAQAVRDPRRITPTQPHPHADPPKQAARVSQGLATHDISHKLREDPLVLTPGMQPAAPAYGMQKNGHNAAIMRGACR